MALGQDASYSGQSKIYIKQQPQGQTLNGNTITTEEVVDVGGLTNRYGLDALNGTILPAKITFGIAPGAANHTVITVTVVDNGGNAVAFPWDLDFILSDSATGVGVTTTTPSGGISVTTGALLNTYITSKACYAQSNGSGVLVVNITDTAKTGFYIMVQAGSQPLPSVSRQLVAGDYG
jgi:hypothetical protein